MLAELLMSSRTQTRQRSSVRPRYRTSHDAYLSTHRAHIGRITQKEDDAPVGCLTTTTETPNRPPYQVDTTRKMIIVLRFEQGRLASGTILTRGRARGASVIIPPIEVSLNGHRFDRLGPCPEQTGPGRVRADLLP